MNLLKEIAVTGALQSAYGLLSLQYTFVNETAAPLSPRYLFPLPQGAVITGFQAMTRDRRLERASVRPIGDSLPQAAGARLLQLEPQLFCLEWASLPPGERCQILVQCTLRLLPQEDGLRLFLPLGLDAPALRALRTGDCPVSISLEAEPSLRRASSPTHSLTLNRRPSCTEISLRTQAGRDFVLDMQVSPAPLCLLAQDLGEGMGFYRLCPETPPPPPKPPARALLLLDLAQAPASYGGIKTLAFRLLTQLPEGTLIQVQTTAPETPTLLPAFTPLSGALPDRLFALLSRLYPQGGSLSAMLEAAAPAPGTLCILCTGEAPDFSAVSCCPSGTAVHLCTTGETAPAAFARAWRQNGGLHCHFYPRNLTAERAAAALRRLTLAEEPFSIVPEDGGVQETLCLLGPSLYLTGYQDVLVRYTGRPPKSFGLWREGRLWGRIAAPEPQLFPQLPQLGQLYAHAKGEALLRLARQVAPGSLAAVRSQLARLGVDYGVLNSETVMLIFGEAGQPEALPVCFYSDSRRDMDAFLRQPSIFGQTALPRLTPGQRERALALCRRVILAGIRSDGAIAAPGVTDAGLRAEQTAYGLLALPRCLAGSPDLPALCQAGTAFLERHPLQNPAAARLLHLAQEPISPRNREALRRLLPPPAQLLQLLDTPMGAIPAAAMLALYAHRD